MTCKQGWDLAGEAGRGRGFLKITKRVTEFSFRDHLDCCKEEDLSFPLLDRVAPLINAMDPFPRKHKYPQYFTEGGKKKKSCEKTRKVG